MSEPQHFDIEALERSIRAQLAEQAIVDDKAIAQGRADPAFMAAQRHYTETSVAFSLAEARAHNDGLTAHIAAAAGVAIGSMLASALAGAANRRQREATIYWMNRTVTDLMSQETTAGGSVARAEGEPMPGSRA